MYSFCTLEHLENTKTLGLKNFTQHSVFDGWASAAAIALKNVTQDLDNEMNIISCQMTMISF